MQCFLSKQAKVTNRTLFAIILPILATPPHASSAHSKGVRQTKKCGAPPKFSILSLPRKAVETL